ncbi:unnamed protein product [Paramecium pentaurelia]|uniref:Uncharacterized protein n=1 Tax=Paramecium pentaurelia TaxID=43138 RepID=A0A8S1XWA9_9CILI|nr:unnamed protein product [Paramecium pentaurelia]
MDYQLLNNQVGFSIKMIIIKMSNHSGNKLKTLHKIQIYNGMKIIMINKKSILIMQIFQIQKTIFLVQDLLLIRKIDVRMVGINLSIQIGNKHDKIIYFKNLRLKRSIKQFQSFSLKVQRNWESIEKLPDLLEFSELIQHQQHLIMKKYFDNFWKTQDIPQVGENIIEDTNYKIKIEKQIVFDSFKQIQIEQENDMQSTYSQIKTKIDEKMNSFKSENKIFKKIIQNYQMKLENLIKSKELDCKIKIQTLIQKYEGEYQKKKGYVQIDNFIQTVLNDEKQKKKFQGNEKLIESEFKKK